MSKIHNIADILPDHIEIEGIIETEEYKAAVNSGKIETHELPITNIKKKEEDA
jgi:hypothetical protein